MFIIAKLILLYIFVFMRRNVKNSYCSKINILCMDVDGTLIDGRIYISATDEAMKAFDVKDGYGIAHICQRVELCQL